MLVQLDTENADLDLTSQVAVLTHTPDASNPMLCQAWVFLGDGVKDLDGTGGDFEFTITVGEQTVQPDPQVIKFSAAVRSAVPTIIFSVPANHQVVLKVKSPNAADDDVDVTAYLNQINAVDVRAIGGDAQSATDLKDFADAGYDPETHKVGGVVLTDTCTTNTDMRGTDGAALAAQLLAYVQLLARKDAAIATDRAAELAEINADEGSGAGTFNNTSDSGEGHRDDALGRLSVARAGYLDNLNIGGNVAASDEVLAIQNNTRVVRVVPAVIERPDAGTTTYRVELLLYDAVGNMEAPDEAPTVDLVDESGNDRTARLDSTTMTLVSVGRYRSVYTASVADDLEQLVWTFSVVEGAVTRLYGNTSLVVDTTAVDFTAADRTKLEAIHTKLPSRDYLAGSAADTGETQTDAAAAIAAAGLTAEDIADEVDLELTTQHGAGSWQQSVGTGEGAQTILVTVTDGVDPVEGARVRFTQGVNSYVGTSDVAGEITFNLDPATYVVAATKSGYTYAGSSVEVVGDAEVPVELTPIAVGPPAEPSQTAAYGTTRDAQGVAEPGVDVEFVLLTPTTEGLHGRETISATSDGVGLVQVDLLRLGEYKMRRTDREVWTRFTTTDTETYELPVI